MKKIIISSFILLFCIATISAQRNYKREFAVGGKFGTTFSRVTLRPSVRQNYEMGYMGGISARYIEEKYFGFIVELNFTQHGWKENFSDEGDYSYSRKLNYIELPFMTHIFFGNRVFRGFVNLGPQVSFLISDKEISSFNLKELPQFSQTWESTQYNMPIAHKFDYGICGGAGIEIKAKKNSFILEGRYYFGLGDFFKNRKVDYFSASSNQTISVALSYMFNLK